MPVCVSASASDCIVRAMGRTRMRFARCAPMSAYPPPDAPTSIARASKQLCPSEPMHMHMQMHMHTHSHVKQYVLCTLYSINRLTSSITLNIEHSIKPRMYATSHSFLFLFLCDTRTRERSTVPVLVLVYCTCIEKLVCYASE